MFTLYINLAILLYSLLSSTKFYAIWFQVRDFEYSPEAQESRKQEMEKLLQDQEAMRTTLLQWCYASYSEVLVFSCII
jgi:hypothetical protein